MNPCFRIAALAFLLLAGRAALAEGSVALAPAVAVELFTSEGCASCPPADAYLGELARRPGILALSYHVDYWDYIGWRDRFADPAFTARQQAYVAALGGRVVYTPQLVIGGAMDEVGADRAGVERALRIAAKRSLSGPLLLAREADGSFALRLPETRLDVRASLWLVTFARRGESMIAAGENRGRRLVSHNVVRSLRRLGFWNGAAETLPLALTAAERAGGGEACAIIANAADLGPVVTAASWACGP